MRVTLRLETRIRLAGLPLAPRLRASQFDPIADPDRLRIEAARPNSLN